MKKFIKLTPYQPWDKFKKLKDHTPISIIKKGEVVAFGWYEDNEFIELFCLSEAPEGGGIMNWEDYKKRTKEM